MNKLAIIIIFLCSCRGESYHDSTSNTKDSGRDLHSAYVLSDSMKKRYAFSKYQFEASDIFELTILYSKNIDFMRSIEYELRIYDSIAMATLTEYKSGYRNSFLSTNKADVYRVPFSRISSSIVVPIDSVRYYSNILHSKITMIHKDIQRVLEKRNRFDYFDGKNDYEFTYGTIEPKSIDSLSLLIENSLAYKTLLNNINNGMR